MIKSTAVPSADVVYDLCDDSDSDSIEVLKVECSIDESGSENSIDLVSNGFNAENSEDVDPAKITGTKRQDCSPERAQDSEFSNKKLKTSMLNNNVSQNTKKQDRDHFLKSQNEQKNQDKVSSSSGASDSAGFSIRDSQLNCLNSALQSQAQTSKISEHSLRKQHSVLDSAAPCHGHTFKNNGDRTTSASSSQGVGIQEISAKIEKLRNNLTQAVSSMSSHVDLGSSSSPSQPANILDISANIEKLHNTLMQAVSSKLNHHGSTSASSSQRADIFEVSANFEQQQNGLEQAMNSSNFSCSPSQRADIVEISTKIGKLRNSLLRAVSLLLPSRADSTIASSPSQIAEIEKLQNDLTQAVNSMSSKLTQVSNYSMPSSGTLSNLKSSYSEAHPGITMPTSTTLLDEGSVAPPKDDAIIMPPKVDSLTKEPSCHRDQTADKQHQSKNDVDIPSQQTAPIMPIGNHHSSAKSSRRVENSESLLSGINTQVSARESPTKLTCNRSSPKTLGHDKTNISEGMMAIDSSKQLREDKSPGEDVSVGSSSAKETSNGQSALHVEPLKTSAEHHANNSSQLPADGTNNAVQSAPKDREIVGVQTEGSLTSLSKDTSTNSSTDIGNILASNEDFPLEMPGQDKVDVHGEQPASEVKAKTLTNGSCTSATIGDNLCEKSGDILLTKKLSNPIIQSAPQGELPQNNESQQPTGGVTMMPQEVCPKESNNTSNLSVPKAVCTFAGIVSEEVGKEVSTEKLPNSSSQSAQNDELLQKLSGQRPDGGEGMLPQAISTKESTKSSSMLVSTAEDPIDCSGERQKAPAPEDCVNSLTSDNNQSAPVDERTHESSEQRQVDSDLKEHSTETPTTDLNNGSSTPALRQDKSRGDVSYQRTDDGVVETSGPTVEQSRHSQDESDVHTPNKFKKETDACINGTASIIDGINPTKNCSGGDKSNVAEDTECVKMKLDPDNETVSRADDANCSEMKVPTTKNVKLSDNTAKSGVCLPSVNSASGHSLTSDDHHNSDTAETFFAKENTCQNSEVSVLANRNSQHHSKLSQPASETSSLLNVVSSCVASALASTPEVPSNSTADGDVEMTETLATKGIQPIMMSRESVGQQPLHSLANAASLSSPRQFSAPKPLLFSGSDMLVSSLHMLPDKTEAFDAAKICSMIFEHRFSLQHKLPVLRPRNSWASVKVASVDPALTYFHLYSLPSTGSQGSSIQEQIFFGTALVRQARILLFCGQGPLSDSDRAQCRDYPGILQRRRELRQAMLKDKFAHSVLSFQTSVEVTELAALSGLDSLEYSCVASFSDVAPDDTIDHSLRQAVDDIAKCILALESAVIVNARRRKDKPVYVLTRKDPSLEKLPKKCPFCSLIFRRMLQSRDYNSIAEHLRCHRTSIMSESGLDLSTVRYRSLQRQVRVHDLVDVLHQGDISIATLPTQN